MQSIEMINKICKELEGSCIEIISEIYFSLSTSWSSTNYGLLYEKFRFLFPKIMERLDLNYVRISSLNFGDEDKDEEGITKNFRVCFYSSDSKSAIQVLENVLIVNHLKADNMNSLHENIVDFALKVYEDMFKDFNIIKKVRRRIFSLDFSLDEDSVKKINDILTILNIEVTSSILQKSSVHIGGSFQDGNISVDISTKLKSDNEKLSLYLDISVSELVSYK